VNALQSLRGLVLEEEKEKGAGAGGLASRAADFGAGQTQSKNDESAAEFEGAAGGAVAAEPEAATAVDDEDLDGGGEI